MEVPFITDLTTTRVNPSLIERLKQMAVTKSHWSLFLHGSRVHPVYQLQTQRGYCAILDVKALNVFIKLHKFNKESTESVLASFDLENFLASVDIKVDSLMSLSIQCIHDFYAFGLLAPHVLAKVLVLESALLHSPGFPIVGYLDDLLLREQSSHALLDTMSVTVQTLQGFGKILSLQKLLLELVYFLEYLGIFLGHRRNFRLFGLRFQLYSSRVIQIPTFCMRVLGLF